MRIRILAYVASGFYCGLAGIILAGLTQSGDPNIGVVYLLNGIAAVVVGGTSLVGGVGTISGSILGAIALSLVSAVLLRQRLVDELPVHRHGPDRHRRAPRALTAGPGRAAKSRP